MWLISICKSGLASLVGPGMPQQGLWPWPGPLAGKWARGGGGVQAQASPDTWSSAGAGRGLQRGAQAAWACLPRGALGAWPMGLPGDGQARMIFRAGMVPCPGSSGIWLLLAHRCL